MFFVAEQRRAVEPPPKLGVFALQLADAPFLFGKTR